MTFITTQSSGGVDASEHDTSSSAYGHKLFQGGTFVDTAPPDPPLPTNYAYLENQNTSTSADSTITGSDTLLGLAASVFSNDAQTYHRMRIGRIPSADAASLQVGDVIYVAVAFKPISLAENYMRLWVSTDVGADVVRAEFTGGSAGQILADNWNDVFASFGEPLTSTDAANRVVLDVESGVHIAYIRLPVVGAIPGNLDVYTGANETGGAEHAAVCLNLSTREFLHDGTPAEAVRARPEAVTSEGFILTGAANEHIVVTEADSQLALAAAPTTDVRDTIVRVEVSGSGTLLLPDTGVTIWGTSDPISTNARLGIRQYSDGSSADIYVVREGV